MVSINSGSFLENSIENINKSKTVKFRIFHQPEAGRSNLIACIMWFPLKLRDSGLVMETFNKSQMVSVWCQQNKSNLKSFSNPHWSHDVICFFVFLIPVMSLKILDKAVKKKKVKYQRW